MGIRKFFTGVLLAAMAAAIPAQAADITLRYANFPPASTFPCVQAEHWITEMGKAAPSVRIDHYPAGTLVDAKSMVRGIMKGQADIGCLSIAYFPGMFPLVSAFELPLGFRSASDASVLLMKAIQEFKPEELEKVKVITAFTCPPSQVMSRKPVQKLADLKGIRLRSSGILADEVALLGGSPVSMPQSEAPDAIQRGAVDGVFTSLDAVKDLNFGESCRNILMTDLSVYPFLVIMNKKTWESLPKDVQNAIDNLALPTAEWTGKYVDQHGQESLDWGKEKYGVTATAMPESDRKEMLAMLQPLVEKWKTAAADKGLPAAKMLEFIQGSIK